MLIKIVPILNDNYVPMVVNQRLQEALVIDPGRADEILAECERLRVTLTTILLTHHHGDHIGGVSELVESMGARVIGHQLDAHRLPSLNQTVVEGEAVEWNGASFQVMHLPGHTTGHIAYYSQGLEALFCGDVLFLMGCGRLFEGTYEQAFESLQRIKLLPPETKIYCAHEYTENNGEFVLSVDAENVVLQKRMEWVREQRAVREPTVPGILAEELETNPFLRAETVDEFKKLRELRNQW